MKLVDIIIGGAAKSGTTSLYNYLNLHPKVCTSSRKEPNYFSKYYDRGKEWYESKFFDQCNKDSLRVESSVSYLVFSDEVAPRLRKDVPGVKLIFVLRDPVERAYSDYWFAVQQGRIQHSKNLFKDLVRGDEKIPSYWHTEYSVGELILRRGMYYKYLIQYYDHFDSNQIKVLLTQDLPSGGFEEMCHFLNLNPPPQQVERENTGRYPANKYVYTAYKAAKNIVSLLPQRVTKHTLKLKSKIRSKVFQKGNPPQMGSDVKNYLKNIYRDPNRKLEELIERDLSGWT